MIKCGMLFVMFTPDATIRFQLNLLKIIFIKISGSRAPFNTLTGVLDGNTVYGVSEKFAR
jgi:hypothetical protein